jgi:hypothetical protein
LKKKVRGGCELPGADMQKPYAPKFGQEKTKIDPFWDFLQKSPMSKLCILFRNNITRLSIFSENFDFMTKRLLLGNNHEIR